MASSAKLICEERSKKENDINLKEKNSVLCAGVFVCAVERMDVCVVEENNIR